LIQQSVPNEIYKLTELFIRQVYWRSEDRIDTRQHGLDRPHWRHKIRGDAGDVWAIAAGRRENIEVMPHRVFQPSEGAIVEEGRL
jgi:hypothetical protein